MSDFLLYSIICKLYSFVILSCKPLSVYKRALDYICFHFNFIFDIELGLSLWCLTPLSIILQLYQRGKFYWWMNTEYPEKTTDLSRTNFITKCCIEYTSPERDSNSNVSSDRQWLHIFDIDKFEDTKGAIRNCKSKDRQYE